jgi:hypothetical protein
VQRWSKNVSVSFDRLFIPNNVAFWYDDLRAILRKALNLIDLRRSCRQADPFAIVPGDTGSEDSFQCVYGPE